MRAQEPHRLARGRAHRRQTEPPDQPVEHRFRRFAGMNDPRGQPQGPGRSRNQQRRRAARATSRRPRACPRSAGRRSLRPAPAAAPRRAPLAPAPRGSTANRHGESPQRRRCRRARPGSPRPAASPVRRSAARHRNRPALRQASAPPSPRPAAQTARGRPACGAGPHRWDRRRRSWFEPRGHRSVIRFTRSRHGAAPMVDAWSRGKRRSAFPRHARQDFEPSDHAGIRNGARDRARKACEQSILALSIVMIFCDGYWAVPTVFRKGEEDGRS